MIIVHRITPKTLGDPKTLLTLPETQRSLEMGRVTGEIMGVDQRLDVPGRPYIALTGMFTALPAGSDEEYLSGALCLPAGVHELAVSEAMRAADEDGQINVPIDITLIVTRASNPQGYSWTARPEGRGVFSGLRRAVFPPANGVNVRKLARPRE